MNGKTILIVDDSQFDRSLMVKALARKGGFTTVEVASGLECLEMLESKKVDLILMDIMMPGAFGTEVLLKIRQRFNAIDLPIIMVTAKDDTSDMIGCLQSGANDYITKPMNFDVAVSRISTHLMLAELSREMSRLREIAALDALITTYNHEINNPLAIAIGCLDKLEGHIAAERLKDALWRIADIVKQIREITDQKNLEFGEYVGSAKLVKFK